MKGPEIGSIGRGISAVPVIGRGIGPSLGIISGFPAHRMEGFSIKAISNPFKTEVPKPQFKVADVIAEAERIVAVAKKPAILERKVTGWTDSVVRAPVPAVVRFPNPTRGLDIRVITNPLPAIKSEMKPVFAPRVENKPETVTSQRIENRVFSETKPEQVVKNEKKVEVEQRQEKKTQPERTEKPVLTKTKIVEAVRVRVLRQWAVSEAARLVSEEALEKGEKVVITAKKMRKFLTQKLWKYISPLVAGRGFDGTIPLTLNAIESDQTEYSSLQEAQTAFIKPVTDHIPLEEGKTGKVATWGEVREVIEGKKKEVIEPNVPAEVVMKKVVQDIRLEPTLQSLGLEELFQRAA